MALTFLMAMNLDSKAFGVILHLFVLTLEGCLTLLVPSGAIRSEGSKVNAYRVGISHLGRHPFNFQPSPPIDLNCTMIVFYICSNNGKNNKKK